MKKITLENLIDVATMMFAVGLSVILYNILPIIGFSFFLLFTVFFCSNVALKGKGFVNLIMENKIKNNTLSQESATGDKNE